MCNLYSMMSNQDAIREFSKFLKVATNAGNLAPHEGIFANGWGPIVRNTAEGRELAVCRWGMPSNPENITTNYDSGVTNVRHTTAKHWQPWLGLENRCVVPATSFSEPDQKGGTKVLHWFALDEDRPLFFFAGIWTPQWKSVRKVKDGETTDDLFAFLTTGANAEVKAFHPKAMPVILRTTEEVEEWFNLPSEDLKDFQEAKQLPNGSLKVVGRGRKKDGPGMPFEIEKPVKVEEPPKPQEPVKPPAQGSLF